MPDKLKNPFQLKIKLLHMEIIYVEGCPAFQRVVIYYSERFFHSWAQKSVKPMAKIRLSQKRNSHRAKTLIKNNNFLGNKKQ